MNFLSKKIIFDIFFFHLNKKVFTIKLLLMKKNKVSLLFFL